jgi:hypothetical protein
MAGRSPNLGNRSSRDTRYLLSDIQVSIPLRGRLGSVVVTMLATGAKVRWFRPGQDHVFLRAIKIRSTPSSRMGSKAGGPMS